MLSLLSRLVNATRTSARKEHSRRRPTLRVESLEHRLALAGFEIAYLGNVGADYTGPTQVYLAGGTNPMTADAWDAYVPPDGYIKNTTRNVEFNSQTVLTSPDSTTGETYITTSDTYTWLFVAETVSANWPFDAADYTTSYSSGYEAAALTTTPPPGVVKYSANTKNAVVTWLAKDADGQPIERYFIRDAWGNTSIMQTSGVTEEAEVRNNFFSAELPRGWRMFAGYLNRDLTTTPAYDSSGFAQFNLFRTSADDAFQQITWGPRGRSIAQQIPDMIIWGGTTSDKLLARRGQDNVIHGGQRNDRIVAIGINDRIYGDGGFDTVVFRGKRSQYVVTRLAADGSLVEVRTRRGGADARVATLVSVEALRFLDRVERTA
ncbi:MAG: hypothetical protein ACKONH_01875, partial [Planctomycetia bacterium]